VEFQTNLPSSLRPELQRWVSGPRLRPRTEFWSRDRSRLETYTISGMFKRSVKPRNLNGTDPSAGEHCSPVRLLLEYMGDCVTVARQLREFPYVYIAVRPVVDWSLQSHVCQLTHTHTQTQHSTPRDMTTTVEQNYARQQTASFRCVVLISSATLHCVQFAICLGGMTQSPGQQSVPFYRSKADTSQLNLPHGNDN